MVGEEAEVLPALSESVCLFRGNQWEITTSQSAASADLDAAASVPPPPPSSTSDPPAPVQRCGQSGCGWRGQGPVSTRSHPHCSFPFHLGCEIAAGAALTSALRGQLLKSDVRLSG